VKTTTCTVTQGSISARVAGRRIDQSFPRLVTVDTNVLGDPLESCSTDPLTGFYRDGCCTSGPEDVGSHTICAVVTREFLAHQVGVGNDLVTPRPEFGFPGLQPGDRWCVVALRWLQAHQDGVAPPVVLAATNSRVLDLVPLDVLSRYAADVPADPSDLL